MARKLPTPNAHPIVSSLALAVFLAACSGGGGGSQPTVRLPDPTPTTAPWSLEVVSAKGTTKARVGGTILLTVVVENSGKAKNDSTEIQISEFSDYGDVVGCTPKCTISESGGSFYLGFPGVGAGKKATFEVELIPTAVGAAHWDICIYDDVTAGDQFFCGELTTTIR